jgi:hypothetical protein
MEMAIGIFENILIAPIGGIGRNPMVTGPIPVTDDAAGASTDDGC